MVFFKQSLVLLALTLLGPVNAVSAEADSELNKGLDFVRVVHNPRALEASRKALDNSFFLAQPNTYIPAANGWIAFDSSLKIVSRLKNFRVPVDLFDVYSQPRSHRIGSIGGECQPPPFLGMSLCSKIMTWTFKKSVLEHKAFEVSGFQFDAHDLKWVESRKSWLGLGYTLKNCSESPSLCEPLDKQFADCEVVEVSASTGRELNRWSASNHISGDEVNWKKWKAGLGGPGLSPTFDLSGSYSDPFHCNSIDYSPPLSKKGVGQIMLSMRHTDSLYAINWPDGQIVWKLGGKPSPFRLPNCESKTRSEGVLLGGQHDARYVSPLRDGGFNISVFDNGNNTKRAGRALLVQIRQVLDCYKIKTVFRDPTMAKSYCTGSFRVLNGGYGLAGWGCSITGATLFDPEGNPIVSTSVDIEKSGWAISALGRRIPEISAQLSYRVIPVSRSLFGLLLPGTNR